MSCWKTRQVESVLKLAKKERLKAEMAPAEPLEKGSHPRFVVTSLPREVWSAQRL